MNIEELELFYSNLMERLRKNPKKFKLDKKTKEKIQEVNIFKDIITIFPDKCNSILTEIMTNLTIKKYNDNEVIFDNNINSLNEIYIIFFGEINIDNYYTEKEVENKNSNLIIKGGETFTKNYLLKKFKIEKKFNKDGDLCEDENCFFKITCNSESIIGFLTEEIYNDILDNYKAKERLECKYFFQRIDYFPKESSFLNKFQKILIKRCFPRQSLICEQNDEIKSIYLIIRGSVQLSIVFNKKIFCSLDYNVLIGKSVNERFYSSRLFEIKGNYKEKEKMRIIDMGEGEILGGIELCKNLKNFLFKMECLTDVVLYEVKIDDFKKFMRIWGLNKFYDKINSQLNIIRNRISKIRNLNQEKNKKSDFNFFQNKFITTYKKGHPINEKANEYIKKYTRPFNFGKIFRSNKFKTLNLKFSKGIDFKTIKESYKNRNKNNKNNISNIPFITNILNDNLSQEFSSEKVITPSKNLNFKYKKEKSSTNLDEIFIKEKDSIVKNEEEKGKKSNKINNLLKLKNNTIYANNFLNKNKYINRRRLNSHKIDNQKNMKISGNLLKKSENKKDNNNSIVKSFSYESNLNKKMHLSLDNVNIRYHLNDEEIKRSRIIKQNSSSSMNNHFFIPSQDINLMFQKIKKFSQPPINKKKLIFPHGIQGINDPDKNNIDEIIQKIISNRLIKREFAINNIIKKNSNTSNNKQK